MGKLPQHESTFRVLEFDRLRELLAGFVQTSMGAARIRCRRVSDDREWIERAHSEVMECVESARGRGHAGLGKAESIDPILKSVGTPGLVLEPSELLQVAALARVGSELRRHLAAESDRWPLLSAYGDRLPALGKLREQIEALLTPEGEIRDDASPELQAVRRQRRSQRDSLRQRMDRLVRDDRLRDALQDRLVTERGGRMVLPVRSDHRERVEGIVHDTSATRQTLYVEPLEVIEQQNQLVELDGRERAEIVRLLAEASAHVGAAREPLMLAQETIARVDELQALARFAAQTGATVPQWAAAGLCLRQAFHPLVERERFVPLDLELDPELQALVITGPNTGGKTVALKTVGLLALMNQSGIPVPAAGARLPIFPRVYADIGDEQSLSANLSTFSAHLGHIIHFLGDCPPGSLVLLDELGTGTDPAEGAALGITLIERFLEQGATVLVSTHHDALKSFAHEHDSAVNAAMQFDPDTLAPTYRIRVGRPGRSNALDIALGLGLEGALIERARGLLQSEAVELDEMIRRLEQEGDELGAQRLAVQEKERQLQETIERFGQAEEKRQRAWERTERDGRQAIGEAVERLRREAADSLREIEARAPSESERTRSDRRARGAAVAGGLEGKSVRRLEARLRRQRQAQDAVAPEPRRIEDADPDPSTPPTAGSKGSAPEAAPLRRGDRVRVMPFGLTGRFMRRWDPGDEPTGLEVDVGGKRLIVRRDQVQRLDEGSPSGSSGSAGRSGRSAEHSGGGTRYQRRYDVKAEIDLHGKIVEEALSVLDKYLDDALLADLVRVRVIHGYGRLRLRDAIHAWLANRAGVVGYATAGPAQGGGGVTIVELGE